MNERIAIRSAIAVLVVLALALAPAPADAKKTRGGERTGGDLPNILAIWGDDIGWFNLSIHNHGIMGYRTPNLDRIGKEGVMFTDAYAEQSCTAGRAAFLTGQHGMRSGMLKVGLPGVPFGLSHEDPTIAEMLKEYGYKTGQFGKNHLGDVDSTLPTTHGFDEFFGNLYHLNAEGEPEHPDYPENPEFKAQFGPRGVIHSTRHDAVPPVIGEPNGQWPDGEGYWELDENGAPTGQYIIDTGPLTRHRMKTIDGAFAKEAVRFMHEAKTAGDPFFVWYAASRMHIWTYLKEDGYEIGPLSGDDMQVPPIDYSCHDLAGAGLQLPMRVCNLSLGDVVNNGNEANDYVAEDETGQGIHPDGMVEHDMYAGQLLEYLDVAGLADDTIVMYTTDNGPESFSWPDGGTTPFRSEKATNWEGGYRVPLLVRWPQIIPRNQGGLVSNEIIALQDWFPTLAAAVSKADGTEIDIKDLLKQNDGYELNGKTYRVHLDGYNFLDYFECLADGDASACDGPRNEFIYANDDGILVAIRYDDWKVVFQEQRAHGFGAWEEPFTYLRLPKIFNLRRDPFEKIDHESSNYDVWRVDHLFINTPAQFAVYAFLETFKQFPPRQAPPSFGINIDAGEIVERCGTPPPLTEDLPIPGPDSDCFPKIDFPAVGGG